jgi:feruloyl esterase
VLSACEALDGIEDGFLLDPRRCDFDPETLLCPDGSDALDCLTAGQVEALKKLYAGPSNPRTGESIFPAFPPGSELGWGRFIGGPEGSIFYMKPNPIANSFFSYMVFQDPEWDFRTFNFDEDMYFTDNVLITPSYSLASAINSTNPDLSKFKESGGKLIMYHGWDDPNIPAGNTINYYKSVVAAMHNGHKKDFIIVAPAPRRNTDDFFRLFMVPGMGHCRGGPGTDQFDALFVLEQWVEQGIAPEKIIASHVEDGTVTMTRPLCPYPPEATYVGHGSTNNAANFECELKGLDRADMASDFEHGLQGRNNARRK